jgi:ubiquinone/menaquinone biosynthesis C-methylase UbiE
MISNTNEFLYVGSELETFQHATKWKTYYSEKIAAFLGEEVLEVGAGIGGTTKLLCSSKQKRWVCLEPDGNMASQIEKAVREKELPRFCEVKVGSLANLTDKEKFDTIIYIDVLEHIENDKEEFETAVKFLKDKGYLIVLSPAHQFLYTPFDKAIGHFRRYNKSSLQQVASSNLKCIKILYLDSVGGLASLGNKLILNSASPNHKQIQFWDKVLVPASRFVDRIFNYKIGKSILGIWQNCPQK